jgi:alpha-D-ribose 1-methylphosphonate 5-triphosphate synthase subunit PhnH
MSKPGKVVQLDQNKENGDDPHSQLMLISSTLMDHETSFCCLGYQAQGLAEKVYSMTKSRIAEYNMADFIIVTGGTTNNQVNKAKIGTPANPDESATLIYLVRGFEKTPSSVTILINGPGIKNSKEISIDGIEKQELSSIGVINKGFPQGLDCIFLDERGNVLCLPRSTNIAWE